MAEVKIYHNPECSKCRQTLDLVRARGVEPEIVEYLENPPDEKTLEQLLSKLGIEPEELVRKKEDLYEELNLEQAGRRELIAAMVENPVLIERPIVVKGEQATLGRPPENVLNIL